MGLTTGLWVFVVVYICHLYRSTAQQIELLEHSVKKLHDKLAHVEKDGGCEKTSSVEERDVEPKTEFSQLEGRITHLRTEVEGVENLVRTYKDEDQEEKLCLIEGMKRIGDFLGNERLVVGDASATAWGEGYSKSPDEDIKSKLRQAYGTIYQ
ncbi:hypothetical protein N431DRAFT_511721 [Stipitochalara longipes BDJ]|nr:hypothetical protein N431DRAFT_511721 [Stipitochalara longipes BDJ]